MSALYRARVSADNGRNGQVRSDDGLLQLAIAMPTALGGQGAATNPEQLFAAGYAACFSSAAQFVAGMQKLQVGAIPVTAEVGLHKQEVGFGLSVKLEAQVDLPQEQARELIATAHQVCPYSNATRGNISVEVWVNGQPL
ncbi:organic hydroperoxide resistance protein [Balneatrix alpica]|uniref:Organic hydroperoxide resistance protein n=1 Tax=Balneatrix alpica TaxID=75684 RepID=A0ABV5ZCJ9_9GAMM|nr:organic hydroperoxide resistance protein [Balneatrix alpica]